MDILLAYKTHSEGTRDTYSSLLPVGLGYINAFLRSKGYRSRIANFSGCSWHKISRLIAAEPPSVLGVTQYTHNRFESLRLARLIKELNPGCFVVFGGPHATHRYKELLSQNLEVDAVVLGEGEETFTALMECLMLHRDESLNEVQGIAFRTPQGITVTAPRPAIAALDTLPFPAAFFEDALGVDLHRQLEFLITSRGCPASCSFCSSPRFWGRRLRFRSPQSIVAEIKYIRDRYGLIYFSIRDDTFTADRKRVLEFCRLLVQEKIYILWNCQSRVNSVDLEMLMWMKRAGCECIQFGVESGSERLLGILGKSITLAQVRTAASAVRHVGMNLSIYLITGVPGETEQDLGDSLALVDEIRAHDGQVSPLAYYPGTEIFDGGVKSGAVAGDVFEADRRNAFYVRSDPFVAHSTEVLLERLERVGEQCSFTPADFHTHKKNIGYCHATNVMAGETYELHGEWRKAESEYREILDQEPENPWGWLMVGELYARIGDAAKARKALANLLRLVPASPGFPLS